MCETPGCVVKDPPPRVYEPRCVGTRHTARAGAAHAFWCRCPAAPRRTSWTSAWANRPTKAAAQCARFGARETLRLAGGSLPHCGRCIQSINQFCFSHKRGHRPRARNNILHAAMSTRAEALCPCSVFNTSCDCMMHTVDCRRYSRTVYNNDLLASSTVRSINFRFSNATCCGEKDLLEQYARL